jgi:hypothetical protein
MMKNVADALLALQGLKPQNNWHFVLHSGAPAGDRPGVRVDGTRDAGAHSRRGPSAVRQYIVGNHRFHSGGADAFSGSDVRRLGTDVASGLASQRKGALLRW